MAMKKFLSVCLVFVSCHSMFTDVELMCDVVNVENEDGRMQTLEMKRLENNKKQTCPTCHHRTLMDIPNFAALRTNLLLHISDKELTPECEAHRDDLPTGLCTFNSDLTICIQNEEDGCVKISEDFGETIVNKQMLPFATGDESIDKTLGLGLVLLNSQNLEAAINTYDSVIALRPNSYTAYFMRGLAYARKGLQDPINAGKAIEDFTEVIQRNKKFIQAYERRAEAYIALGNPSLAVIDISKAIDLKESGKLHFARGVLYLLLQDYAAAEVDFKKNIDSGADKVQNLFYLGLTHYYKGRVRNAIEVFKEVLNKDPDHLEACTSLAQAFREVGNVRMARSKFNQSLALNPRHTMTLQLRGDLFYHSGEPALALTDFKKCAEEDPDNYNCEYMQSLAYTSVGNFFQGVKSATKVMVQSTPVVKASPEFLRSHYLREYARYLHSNLELPLESLDIDSAFPDEYKDHWLQNLPFDVLGYKEQPGIQPHIKDVGVLNLGDYSRAVQNLICKAHKIGWLMQVNTDGYTPNKRLNLAMGLASVHVAQLFEAKWRSLRLNQQIVNNKHTCQKHDDHGTGHQLTWRDVFNLAVRYRRMVDPEQPVLWLDKIGEQSSKNSYKTTITLIKGSVNNIKTMPYYNLVFKLVKTMLEHYSVSSETLKSKQTSIKEDIENSKTCEDLLTISKKYQPDQNGFVVSTQVPSTRKRSEKDRLDGAMLVLTEDISKQIMFTIDVASTHTRAADYHAELSYIYNQLQDEIRRTGSSKVSEMDPVINIILSLSYYFYNLMPLSRGSSVVAYSVALGLIMSLGRQVTGKIPTSKLLEMEAMLSGAPDAFILVTKQWMNIKRYAFILVTKQWMNIKR
ncbi:tetratricopeptide repeat protein 13-like isoform X2 [Dreissena polymorpha]|uniref:tetratricopeptide repeat protein 13-like isoform X2 n=1 Tax=Dreissena polymorpha TaxID=45954 RepID=UPI002263B814|nr:tetratricopeptide repeat protein 13-like isoform X2 [Dreissena polymorpha]